MKLFLSFIKLKLRYMIICMLFSAIFVISFILFRVPFSAAVYPFVLCLFVGLCFLIYDYIKFRKRHVEFQHLIETRAFLVSDIPESRNIEDEAYCEIIRLLRQELSFTETQAETKYRDMTDYYTVWVHQIKTPIASMKLLLENEDTAEYRKLSSDLFRIEQYVSLVLAFLRLNSVSTDYVFREYKLDGMIKSTVRKFASDFIYKKIRLDYEETELSFVTDEKWFSLVLEQLISNALKYTREGYVHICEKDKKLYIEDTGIGISPEDISRVFEEGFTGLNGRKDKSASGIGLSLCKRVCDNLSVPISISSEVGKGTTVILDLSQHRPGNE